MKIKQKAGPCLERLQKFYWPNLPTNRKLEYFSIVKRKPCLERLLGAVRGLPEQLGVQEEKVLVLLAGPHLTKVVHDARHWQFL